MSYPPRLTADHLFTNRISDPLDRDQLTRIHGMTEMTELQRERAHGRAVAPRRSESVRRISLADLDTRRDQIADNCGTAATEVQVLPGGRSRYRPRRHACGVRAMSERFFALPDEVKARWPKRYNSGWEQLTQIRPSVGVPDQKESYQVTLSNMDGLWPSEQELAQFSCTIRDFEHKCWALAMELLSLFAGNLGFEQDFFTRAHDPSSPTYQSTLRLLHYFALPADADLTGVWRAGAHTDFDCLTLLFQRAGRGGLQVCPGKERDAQEWTSVHPSEEAASPATSVTC